MLVNIHVEIILDYGVIIFSTLEIHQKAWIIIRKLTDLLLVFRNLVVEKVYMLLLLLFLTQKLLDLILEALHLLCLQTDHLMSITRLSL